MNVIQQGDTALLHGAPVLVLSVHHAGRYDLDTTCKVLVDGLVETVRRDALVTL